MEEDTLTIPNRLIIFLIVVVSTVFALIFMMYFPRPATSTFYFPCKELIGESNGTRIMHLHAGFIIGNNYIEISKTPFGIVENGTIKEFLWVLPDKFNLTCVMGTTEHINITFKR